VLRHTSKKVSVVATSCSAEVCGCCECCGGCKIVLVVYLLLFLRKVVVATVDCVLVVQLFLLLLKK
jgi:hypothetical protein